MPRVDRIRNRRRNPAARRPGLLTGLLFLLVPAATTAHEIPDSVRVLLLAGVTPAEAQAPGPGPRPGTFRLFVTAPLDALRELDPPLRADGTLDVAGTRPRLPDAVRLWIGDELALHVPGRADPPLELRSVRMAPPGALRFPSLRAAEAARQERLSEDARLPPGQVRVVAEFAAPVPDVDAPLRLTSRLEHLGQRTRTVLRSRTADGRLHTFTWIGGRGPVPLAPTLADTVGSLFPAGLTHVLGGVDHLLFVLCLVLPVRRLRPLVLLVTAFTVAHSITLGAVALGVAPSALWFDAAVEVGIAASVACLAVLNLLGPRGGERWPLAFAFGLLHGFSFGGALTEELQWAGDHVAVALAAFNLGVEAGQVLVVLALLALLRDGMSLGLPERPVVLLLSGLVLHESWHWLTARGAALAAYRIDLGALVPATAQGALDALLVVLLAALGAWLLAELDRRSRPRAPGPPAARDRERPTKPAVPTSPDDPAPGAPAAVTPPGSAPSRW